MKILLKVSASIVAVVIMALVAAAFFVHPNKDSILAQNPAIKVLPVFNPNDPLKSGGIYLPEKSGPDYALSTIGQDPSYGVVYTVTRSQEAMYLKGAGVDTFKTYLPATYDLDQAFVDDTRCLLVIGGEITFVGNKVPYVIMAYTKTSGTSTPHECKLGATGFITDTDEAGLKGFKLK